MKCISQGFFSVSTRLCNCHRYLTPENVYHHVRNPLPLSSQSAAPFPQTLAPTDLPSVSLVFLFWAFHPKGNTWRHVFFCPASVTQHSVSYFHPCCSMDQTFISFHVQIIIHRVDRPHFVWRNLKSPVLEITIHWQAIRKIKPHNKMKANGNIRCIFPGSFAGTKAVRC